MHATSKTNPTAIMSAIRIEIRSEMARKRSDGSPGRLVRVRVIAGQASSNRLQFRPRLSRCAPVGEPADHLKETLSRAWLASPGRRASGCHRSLTTGNRNPSGMTPITVEGTPLTRTLRPTMAGSALYLAIQTRLPNMTTAGAPGRSSSGTKSRPSAGFSPSN